MNKTLKQRSRDLRKNLTPAEQKLWHGIRGKQLHGYKFRRQMVLGNYIVDFICLEKRLIVEVDGGQHMDNANYDSQRDEWLQSQNFTVLRFWNNQILNELESVLESIAEHLTQNPPPPNRGDCMDAGVRTTHDDKVERDGVGEPRSGYILCGAVL